MVFLFREDFIHTMNRLFIFYTILFSLYLYSCQSEDREKYLIGVSQCSDDMWRQKANNEMLRELSFYPNLSLEIKSVKDEPIQQIKDIEYFIEKKVDLLIVSPAEGSALTPVIQKVYHEGIPVILLDRRIDSEDYTAYVGADNYELGYEAGLYVAGFLNGKGNVVEIRGWDKVTAEVERHNGFTNAVKRYPDIKLIAQPYGNFQKETAERKMQEIIEEGEPVDVVFAMNDAMAIGANKAYERYSGKRPYIIGVDALPGEGGGIENIQNNLQDASFIYPTGGDKVIEVANLILTGEPFKKENILYTAVVDKNNVRMLQLQTEQISEHQDKLETMNSLLNKSLIQYSNQQTLFYGTILILVLISILLFVSVIAYRSKSKTNRLLEEQKNQLISLSKQLEEATHAKLVFFTNISHEFRTPLTLILGPVETLLSTPDLTKEQKQLLDLVKRNSNTLLNLISQVIEFRSHENGKMRAYFSEGNIKQFLEELNVVFSDYAKRRQVDFSFESPDESLLMWFDKEKVEKIYFNLLSNAFKHTERGGKIEVSLEKESADGKRYARIQVYNKGKAIPKDKIKSIFERFYKVNPNDVGTGIGLALTNALVDVHGGKITVESEENYGTVFTVWLPIEQIQNEVAVTHEIHDNAFTKNLLASEPDCPEKDVLASSLPETDKPIILLIEDNPDMRNYMKYVLQHDYTVIEAEDGEIGLEKAIKHVPDVVVSDVMMPNKDGFEVCHVLKQNISTSHIPIILLTASSLDEQKAIGFESGADAYITKPFNAELLKIRIRKLIENRQKIIESFGKSLINDSKKTTLAEAEQNFIDRFRKYIEERISDPDLNIDEVAQNMGLSKSQLYRKIKSLTDYSPNELIKIIRLKYARHLLSLKNQNISEVAYKSGFSSLSYFTKCFKDFYKESPTEFITSSPKISKG